MIPRVVQSALALFSGARTVDAAPPSASHQPGSTTLRGDSVWEQIGHGLDFAAPLIGPELEARARDGRSLQPPVVLYFGAYDTRMAGPGTARGVALVEDSQTLIDVATQLRTRLADSPYLGALDLERARLGWDIRGSHTVLGVLMVGLKPEVLSGASAFEPVARLVRQQAAVAAPRLEQLVGLLTRVALKQLNRNRLQAWLPWTPSATARTVIPLGVGAPLSPVEWARPGQGFTTDDFGFLMEQPGLAEAVKAALNRSLAATGRPEVSSVVFKRVDHLDRSPSTVELFQHGVHDFYLELG